MARKRKTQYAVHSTNPVYAVILVGGKGKRLRPLSTDARPKAFLSITKDRKTMFAKTADRIRRLIPGENILVVANSRHTGLIRKDFNISKENLLLEPVSRNTAPAITFAASRLMERGRDVVMVVLPSDHYIADEARYLAALKRGIEFAKKSGDALVVLGLKPTFPATEFGYIKTENRTPKTGHLIKVERFVEKPDLTTAKKYLKDGGYLWNSGVFIFRASSILRAVKAFAPEIFKGLKNPKDLKGAYRAFEDISIDYAVMEKADNIYCIKGSYGWHDVGNFGSLEAVLRREGRSFVSRRGRITRLL